MCLWMGIRGLADFDRFRQVSGAPPHSTITPPADAIRSISVSTTLSAAEFNSTSGVTDSLTRTKEGYTHRLFVPQVVVLDPASTLDTPMRLLRATAIRSFDHAIETHCSPLANPATEALSLQGLRLLAGAVRAMPGAPGDLDIAMQAQFGMWQAISAAVAGVPTGASHGIGYALGASFGVPHGETSCVMLPAVLQWNASRDDFGQSEIASALGCPGEAPGPALRALVSSLGLPSSLRELGLTRAQFGEISDRALAYPHLANNRVPVTTREQVEQILELAF
jgi:maleylacetate reductase